VGQILKRVGLRREMVQGGVIAIKDNGVEGNTGTWAAHKSGGLSHAPRLRRDEKKTWAKGRSSSSQSVLADGGGGEDV